MSQSPYAPPTAEVRDAEEPPRVRPESMRRAVVCLRVSAVLAAVVGMLQLTGTIPAANPVMAVGIAAISAALLALLAVKVGTGRNWARWVFVVI